jgi:hypothetical protein
MAETKTQHIATYASDKRKGGYMVRIVGPHANAFAGREVPITRRDGTASKEILERLTWSGPDTDKEGNPTGKNAALYTFKAKPRNEDDEIPF